MSVRYDYPELTNNLSAHATIVGQGAWGFLKQYYLTDGEALDALNKSWSNAFDRYLVEETPNGGLTFPVEIQGLSADRQVMAKMVKNQNRNIRTDWVITFVGFEKSPQPTVSAYVPSSPSHVTADNLLPQPSNEGGGWTFYRYRINDWAFWKDWNKVVLPEVADVAIAEDWDGQVGASGFGSKKYVHPILYTYLRQTFNRLADEQKICVNGAGDFAAFNTGLVDDEYRPIYLCFSPNDPDKRSKTPWCYEGASVAGSRGLGKRLVEEFNPLPEAACYYDSVADLVFDPHAELYLDYDHIIAHNIDRFPGSVLRDALRDNPAALNVVQFMQTDSKWATDQLKRIVRSDADLYKRLKGRVDEAVQKARLRALWSYRTAVPSFYPPHNSIALLLPLCLEGGNKPSVALVLSRGDSGNYQGHTILPLSFAYSDARLIAPPQSDWLTA